MGTTFFQNPQARPIQFKRVAEMAGLEAAQRHQVLTHQQAQLPSMPALVRGTDCHMHEVNVEVYQIGGTDYWADPDGHLYHMRKKAGIQRLYRLNQAMVEPEGRQFRRLVTALGCAVD